MNLIVTRYIIEKSLAFLYNKNEKKNRNQGNNPIHHWHRRIKYIGINQPKETKYLYVENSKRLMKEIKDKNCKYIVFLD